MERGRKCWRKLFKCSAKIRNYGGKFFFGELFTDVFNSIYNQQVDKKSARNVIVGFFLVIGVTTAIVVGVNTYKNFDFSEKKIETKKPEVKVKKETKKPEVKVKKETKKPEVKVKKEVKKNQR